MKRFIILLGLILWTNAGLFAQSVPLPNAHAHNDYLHQRPLFDALDHGFTSIEADIHLVNGELLVSHDAPVPGKAQTLKELYLEPLRQRVTRNGGWVYPDHKVPLLLLIDIKTEAEGTYQVLRKQLDVYENVLVRFENGKAKKGAVLIVLSGNRPVETVSGEKSRLVCIDGRPTDLSRTPSAELMPLISTHYGQVVQWNGEGEMPAPEVARLRELARQTHAQGKKLRLWATPESEKVWETLLAAGVDYLNTDQLARLEAFLRKRNSTR